MAKIIIRVQTHGEDVKVAGIKLQLLDANGQDTGETATTDETGQAVLAGVKNGRYYVKPPYDSEDFQHLMFAFSDVADAQYGPLLEKLVIVRDAAAETAFPLHVWNVNPIAVGSNPDVDRRFTADVFKIALLRYDELIRQSFSTHEAWNEIDVFVKNSLPAQEQTPTQVQILSSGLFCSTCRNRYYTPGTVYYMNFAAYNTCMYNPPCNPSY